MTPTLMGRIQTRLLLLFTVGMAWTFFFAPFLVIFNISVGLAYAVTFTAIFITAIFGSMFWEPLYHLLQQWRWEKDWPIALGFITGFPELILTYLIIWGIYGPVNFFAFWLHFTSTWILVWLVANGPMRVVFLRWRYQGGKIV